MAGPRDLVVRTGTSTHEVRVAPDAARDPRQNAGAEVVEVVEDAGGGRVAVEMTAAGDSTFVAVVGPARHVVHVAVDGERTWAASAGLTFEVEPAVRRAAAEGAAAEGAAVERAAAERVAPGAAARPGSDAAALSAPMPATVTAVLVRAGRRVAAGEPLVRLEAMKMELAVRAPRAGRVAAVRCREGDLVQPGRPLVVLEGDAGRSRRRPGAGDG